MLKRMVYAIDKDGRRVSLLEVQRFEVVDTPEGPVQVLKEPDLIAADGEKLTRASAHTYLDLHGNAFTLLDTQVPK